MNTIKGDRILVISPTFFGYGCKIEETLCKLGAYPTYLTVDKKGDTKKIDDVLIKQNKFEYLFVIKGEFIDPEIINRIKLHSNHIYKILYLYDSIDRYPEVLKNIESYDKVFSFERGDCKKYSFTFRPLFYIDEFLIKSEKEIYDISSISSYYPNRLNLFNQITKSLSGHKLYLKLYISKKSILRNMLLKLLFYKDLIITKPLSFEKISKIQSMSKTILDIIHPKQEGLTIRTIETMALGKKLITTNSDIINYDFYNPQNIYLLTESNIDELSDFLSTDYEDIPNSIKQKYSIEYFINFIFDNCI